MRHVLIKFLNHTFFSFGIFRKVTQPEMVFRPGAESQSTVGWPSDTTKVLYGKDFFPMHFHAEEHDTPTKFHREN